MSTTNMEAQLRELYRDKEVISQAFPGVSAQGLIELMRSIQGQIDTLLEEQFNWLVQERDRLYAAFPGKSIDQIIELARRGAAIDGSTAGIENPAMTASMEAQLVDLYEEREKLSVIFPGMDAEEIVTEISAKVKRLEALYARAA